VSLAILQYICAKNYENSLRVDKVIPMKKWQFLAHPIENGGWSSAASEERKYSLTE